MPLSARAARATPILAFAALAWVSAAHAFSAGIATTSFPVPAQGCNFCHLGGAAPGVMLECVDCGGEPPSVEPLSVHELKLTIFESGLQDHGGLNVSSAHGTLSTGGGHATDTQAVVGAGGLLEITHTAPKPAAGGMIEFSFLWTAPALPTSATLSAWGNAVNGDGSTAGDAASAVVLNIAVGGETPTPTETPTFDLLSTPTPTPTPPAGCPPSVDPGCTGGFAKGLLVAKENVAGKEKLVAKLLRGPALAQVDMGNPLDAAQGGTGTSYSLCVYDGDDALAGGVRVDRAGDTCDGPPCWRPIGRAPNDPQGPGRGYRYRDRLLDADGVRKLVYRGGDTGKSQAIVVGRGPGLPTGLAAALQASADVTVQLRSSDGLCLSVTLGDVRVQEPSFFKAR